MRRRAGLIAGSGIDEDAEEAMIAEESVKLAAAVFQRESIEQGFSVLQTSHCGRGQTRSCFALVLCLDQFRLEIERKSNKRGTAQNFQERPVTCTRFGFSARNGRCKVCFCFMSTISFQSRSMHHTFSSSSRLLAFSPCFHARGQVLTLVLYGRQRNCQTTNQPRGCLTCDPVHST